MTASPARQAILDRARRATGNDIQPSEEIPRNYVHQGALDQLGKVNLMTQRLHDYGAEVLEIRPDQLPSVIVHQIQLSGRHPIAVPSGLPFEWLGKDVDWKLDNNLSYEEIEHCGGVLTAASAGIADSGTLVLHHGPQEGRRVITLLPDLHLCILRASQILETLPEYFARFPDPPRLATFISGPSATADIEMTRIKGVHGPRFLCVIIVGDSP